MNRSILVVALAASLGGCVSLPHLPAFHMPATAPVPPVASAAALCTTDMTSDLDTKPDVPDGAKIPAAETPDASAGFQVYLSWLKDLSNYADDGWARLQRIKTYCASH